MIKKLYKMGKYIPEEYFEDNPLGLNLEYGKNGDKKIVFLKFKSIDNWFEYEGVTVEDYDPVKNKTLYLLKNAPGMSISPFPTLFYESKLLINKQIDIKSKSSSKLIRILEANAEIESNISNILNILQNDFESGQIELDNDFILSLKINDKYLGESEYYKTIIDQYKSDKFIGFYNKYNKKSLAKNKFCYICNKRQEDNEVWGFVDLNDFKFYSSNEDSVIAGGFNKENSWKNYPVCSMCATDLVKYKQVLEKYLSFYFYGYNYFLVPEIVFDNPNNKEVIDIFINEQYGLLKFKQLKTTQYAEDEIFDLLKEHKNFVNYNLFFYERNNSEFKILLSIDDVFPSRFKQLYDVKKESEKYNIFKNIKGIIKKGEISDLSFSFGIIKNFLPNNKQEGNFSSYFLETVRAIFVGKKIDYDFMLSQIMRKIRHSYANGFSTEYDLLKAVLLIKFIHNLNLWNKKKYNEEKELIMEDNDYTSFFSEHSEFFDTNSKKAIFLEGVLCQNLLDIQYQERSSTPFRARLNGLKLDEKYIKKLLPEIINKLEEYGKNYYKQLEQIISQYLLESNFNMTNDEISFYFVMGMNLSKNFKAKKQEEENNGNN